MDKVLLFNPRAARYYPRIPMSILQIAASIKGEYEYVIVDGNREKDPWEIIKDYLSSGEFRYFASTVMPGPQLKQAIPYTKRVRRLFPETGIIWGGYFPSAHYKIVLDSGYVDYVIDGPGDNAFPQLLAALGKHDLKQLAGIKNLIYRKNGEIVKNPKEPILDQDVLPPLPYRKLDQFYPIQGYFGKTFLGENTAAYHSSFGCPFTCSFCAVVPIYKARWKGKSAEKIYEDILFLKHNYGVDAVEFHDNNFFVSEKRVREFSKLMLKENLQWWGESRIDTMDKFRDETLHLMREAGCRMIFFGAESGNDDLLKKMDKGGKQNAEQMRKFARRMKDFGIIPEYSFILGFPSETEEEVNRLIDDEIRFIRESKAINPKSEIVFYIYSPVPTEGSELYESSKNSGFQFPEKLEDWTKPEWLDFDLRKNPLTPWLKPYMVDRIRNFETVLNAMYPTNTDYKVSAIQRKIMGKIASWRYNNAIYKHPYELKFLQKYWLAYRQPEIEGFHKEVVDAA